MEYELVQDEVDGRGNYPPCQKEGKSVQLAVRLGCMDDQKDALKPNEVRSVNDK